MVTRRRRAVEQVLFDENASRLQPAGEFAAGVPILTLDVPETIPQLGYGSHQFFRYYGKFPSIVGREIIARHGRPGMAILDCYAGSGTTLVEAQIAGMPSFGLDINPLAVLACNVKTTYYDRECLRDLAAAVLAKAQALKESWRPSRVPSMKLSKWFDLATQEELGRLRLALDELKDGPDKNFLLVAFLAIVRRCSTAYDGEVRPHVNPGKLPKSPFKAFQGKVEDMLAGLMELDTLRPRNVESQSVIADNRDPSAYAFTNDAAIGLLVAHPPYLNSFNYLQVFSLEFYWSEDLGDVWQGFTPEQIKASEHVAWPATKSSIRDTYYSDFEKTIKAAASCLAPGGNLAVVVGDATIRGVLEPVHSLVADGLTASGLEPVEVWYRTTHYGIGKYAYAHRADYHGTADKKDAILFFRKPSDAQSTATI